METAHIWLLFTNGHHVFWMGRRKEAVKPCVIDRHTNANHLVIFRRVEVQLPSRMTSDVVALPRSFR